MSNLVCTSCHQPKQGLRKRKSKLIGSLNLLLCVPCFDKKYEPRYAIIITAREYGLDRVEDFIKNRRYSGDEITARELL